jgi:hypothetical protein
MAKIHNEIVGGAGVEIKSALLAGAAADTNIAVTGLSWKKRPRFFACVKLEGTATYTAPVDLLSEVKRGTTDGSIQLETTATTGDHLLVFWIQSS